MHRMIVFDDGHKKSFREDQIMANKKSKKTEAPAAINETPEVKAAETAAPEKKPAKPKAEKKSAPAAKKAAVKEGNGRKRPGCARLSIY